MRTVQSMAATLREDPVMDADRAKQLLTEMTDRVFLGVDLARGRDVSAAVAMRFNPDGSVEWIDHRTFYADPADVEMQQDPTTGTWRAKP